MPFKLQDSLHLLRYRSTDHHCFESVYGRRIHM